MRKGITLIETIIILFIVSIISLLSFIRVERYLEEKEIVRAKLLFQTLFSKYSKQSYYSGDIFTIKIYLEAKKIEVYKSTELKEKIVLPRELSYRIVYDRERQKIFTFQTTEQGNLSKSFTIYIFDKKNKARIRIALYIFQEDRILKINTYRNSNAKGITLDNIIEYHYSEKGEKRDGWKEEF